MKFNPIRYSSAVGESWHHFSSKTKYCHKIFDIKEVREECCRLLVEAFERNSIRYEEIGFDNNHFHAMVDLGLYSRPQLAKLVRGYVGKKLLARFPSIKQKYFYGSGLWNPAYYLESVGKDKEFIKKYIRKQKYFSGLQKKLNDFFWFFMPPVCDGWFLTCFWKCFS